MNESIKKRISALKAQIEPETVFCMVELQDGTQAEKTIEEWYEHRKGWKWERMTRGGDNAAVMLLLAAIDDEAAEDAMKKGDNAAAVRLTAESAKYLAQYERRSSG